MPEDLFPITDILKRTDALEPEPFKRKLIELVSTKTMFGGQVTRRLSS